MARSISYTSKGLPPTIVKLLDPSETAIIVIDVMDAYFNKNAILPQLVGSTTTKLEAVAQKIDTFLSTARQYNLATVVFTKMVERPETMPKNYRYKMEEVEGTPSLVEENGPGWNYFQVQPQQEDFEIIKRHYNAFTDTALHAHLQEKRVKTIILVGGYGSRCVASTAIVGADVYGYNVFVPKDLVANLDSADIPIDGEWANEVKGFLQALNAIWGYAPSSEAILNVWNQTYTK
jgi:nicotinamidase-related amidase